MSTTQTRINAGKHFENYCAKQIEEAGLGAARREIGSGSGQKKGDIFANIPFLLECKAHKALNVWKGIRQAKDQAEIGNWDSDKWALIIREPRSPTENPNAYAVIDYHEFLKLLKKDKEPLIKEPDNELKWKLKKLKQLSGEVERSL